MESFKNLVRQEISGDFGHLKLIINVACNDSINLYSDNIIKVKRKAAEMLLTALKTEIKENDPKTFLQTAKNKELLKIFTQPIYVEEIPNGYCSRYCCKHLPWFIVTTSKGRIKIGWRKRVIQIDWTDSDIIATAEHLFLNEEVTKGPKYIHAWSIEKAKEYINKLLA